CEGQRGRDHAEPADHLVLARGHQQHDDRAGDRQEGRDGDGPLLPGRLVHVPLVPYLKMNRLSAITPANSPTAYHCTLPDWSVRRPFPNVSATVPTPFTMPSMMLRSIHMITPEPLR